MSQPLVLKSDLLEARVFPRFGGKIASLVDRADGFELLFNYPAELPTVSLYDRPYAEGWYAGWDECLPAISASAYVGHPYHAIHVPDHGELWGLPAPTALVHHGVSTTWHGLRFGYRLTRKLSVEGPRLTADYLLENLAPFEFRFVWAAHALMSMASPVRLDVAAGTCRIADRSEGRPVDRQFDWPALRAGEDLSQLDALPAKRAWKAYGLEPIAASARVIYPQRGRTLTVSYTSDDGQDAWWGIWINTGQWEGHRHFALEPTTGRYDAIGSAIHDGCFGRVAPAGTRQWRVTLEVGALERPED